MDSPPQPALLSHNEDRLRMVLNQAVSKSRFYAEKYRNLGIDVASLRFPESLANLPFTTKNELAQDQIQHPPFGRNHTELLERYTRLHQTSGTSTGRPLRWLDTPESWDWLLTCWQATFPLLGIRPKDVLFFPFSYGPFLGFWTAFEASAKMGYRVLAGGGMPSTARLRFLLELQATVVFATPTYALHLTRVAAEEGIDLAGSAVRAIVVAGEPGGLIPATRNRIESGWGARVFDHYGMTEVGPVAAESVDEPGSLQLLEDHYWAEVIDPQSLKPTAEGDIGELVLTNLGRLASPVIRYRTGDLVRVGRNRQGRLCLQGGILGRADDMIHVRGNNLYPSALEAIIRRFPGVHEFRLIVDQSGPLADLRLQIEPLPDHDPRQLAEEVAQAIQDGLLFRTQVEPVAPGTLPRFEMKARRVVRIPTTV